MQYHHSIEQSQRTLQHIISLTDLLKPEPTQLPVKHKRLLHISPST